MKLSILVLFGAFLVLQSTGAAQVLRFRNVFQVRRERVRCWWNTEPGRKESDGSGVLRLVVHRRRLEHYCNTAVLSSIPGTLVKPKTFQASSMRRGFFFGRNNDTSGAVAKEKALTRWSKAEKTKALLKLIEEIEQKEED